MLDYQLPGTPRPFRHCVSRWLKLMLLFVGVAVFAVSNDGSDAMDCLTWRCHGHYT